MSFLKKYGFYFFMLGIVSDFLTPYVLGVFFPKMNQMKMVISVFGDVDSPVRMAFLIWSTVSGLFFVLALPALYQTIKIVSLKLAIFVTLAVGFYGIGDCLFTGLFSINTEEATWNFSTWVHNIGSALGYTGFLLFPCFVFFLYRKQGRASYARLYFILTIISFVFALIYGVARIPIINGYSPWNQIGFFQRISFFFNYLPMFIFTLDQIKQGRSRA
ncbi:DUF998 domain-containing protein [Carnobacterium gallinarum]|uniref:DUF998 domain-containing protein n=1 Tax=Carnobacterium gallinarum TaxID=2749 RepID=UPI00055448E3|nr:DUF998 domain-containing protein [Carnobacterium gallinarum]